MLAECEHKLLEAGSVENREKLQGQFIIHQTAEEDVEMGKK